MSQQWPDTLSHPNPDEVAALLTDFWTRLADLPDIVKHREHLLCAECTADLRRIVLSMMLALNGISRPPSTKNLNVYLSRQQRTALQKTLGLHNSTSAAWVGQAVALTVIYRWYAPQLVDKYEIPYPEMVEKDTLHRLSDALPNWPRTITSD